MFLLHILSYCLISAASARMAFQFASGFEELFGGEPDKSFSCDDRAYGYYADVQNDCKIFHICNPILNEDGEVTEVDHYSFICGNQTVFSQESLTCAHPEDAFPCAESTSLYELVNSEFGRILEGRSDNQDEIDRIKSSAAASSAARPSSAQRKPSPAEVEEAAAPLEEESAAVDEGNAFGIQVEEDTANAEDNAAAKSLTTGSVASEDSASTAEASGGASKAIELPDQKVETV